MNGNDAVYDVSDAIAVTSRMQKCPIYEVLPSPSRDLCGTEKLYRVGSKLRKHDITGGKWMPKVGDSTSVKMAILFPPRPMALVLPSSCPSGGDIVDGSCNAAVSMFLY